MTTMTTVHGVIAPRVVPASREALLCFTMKDLRAYAKELGVRSSSSKWVLVDDILRSGKATLCAFLGD